MGRNYFQDFLRSVTICVVMCAFIANALPQQTRKFPHTAGKDVNQHLQDAEGRMLFPLEGANYGHGNNLQKEGGAVYLDDDDDGDDEYDEISGSGDFDDEEKEKEDGGRDFTTGPSTEEGDAKGEGGGGDFAPVSSAQEGEDEGDGGGGDDSVEVEVRPVEAPVLQWWVVCTASLCAAAVAAAAVTALIVLGSARTTPAPTPEPQKISTISGYCVLPDGQEPPSHDKALLLLGGNSVQQRGKY